jgi:hypothetical protein
VEKVAQTPLAKSPQACNDTYINQRETPMANATRLTGDAMLERLRVVNENANVLRIEATATMKAEACGYVKEDGKADYVAFYTALIEAKGLNIPDDEDEEMGDTESELRERFSDEAVDAFIDIWSVDDLEYFEEAYQGEFRDGAEFAEQLVSDCYGLSSDIPSFVEIDWEATWGNLRYDYCEQDGFIFCQNW